MIYPATRKRVRVLRTIAFTIAAALVLAAGAIVAFMPH